MSNIFQFIENEQDKRGYNKTQLQARFCEHLMTTNPEQAIKNLQQAIKKEDHNEVYEYSKILLKQFPDDQEYQQCSIISSLKINVLDDLQIIFKNPPTKESLKPLYVYYLYFIGEYEKTISYLENLMQKSSESSYKILMAQAYFKLNDQASSAKIMLQLLKDSNKLERQDLQFYLVNLFATSINKSFDESLINKYRNITKQKYAKQVYYNFALLLVSLADYRSALEFLGEFQKNLKKPEDQNEFKMSQVLRDFINFKTSKKIHLSMDIEQKEQKIQQYEKMEEQVTQVNLQSVIRNNKIFLKYQNGASILQNFHEILKAIDEGLEKKSKTTKPQQFVLKLNKYTILLKKNRLNEATKVLKDLQLNYQPEIYLNSNLNFIKGKFFLLKKSSKDNTKQNSDLNGFLSGLSKYHANLAFCLRADLKKQQDKQKDLISELREQTSHSSIIKNFLFSLLIKNPEMFEIYHQYLSQLLSKTTDFKILDILLRLYENKQDLAKQEAILNKILQINSKDFNAKVKLAQIYINRGKFEEAEELLRGVQEPQEINDINYLQHIEKNIHVSVKKDDQIQTIVPPKKGQEKQPVVSQQAKKRIKKKRRPRYPKNMQKFVEGFKGDPQRWLPKWQRKGYKKKGKKGAGKTQGLATVGRQETKNVFTTNASTSAKQVTKQAVKKRK